MFRTHSAQHIRLVQHMSLRVGLFLLCFCGAAEAAIFATFLLAESPRKTAQQLGVLLDGNDCKRGECDLVERS